MGVLGPGFWDTRRLAKLIHTYIHIHTLVPERPIIPVCINYRAWNVGEKKKDKDFLVLIFYCRIKQDLNIYIDYVLQQWAAEEQELLIKA